METRGGQIWNLKIYTFGSMNNQDDRILIRTNYLLRPWTWVRRIALIIVLFTLGQLNIAAPFMEWKWAAIVILSLTIVLRRRDEMALNGHSLFIYKRSLIPLLNSFDVIKLSDITSFRFTKIHGDGWEIVDVLNGGGHTGGLFNIVELTLKSNRSKSYQLAIEGKWLAAFRDRIYRQNGFMK